MLGAFSGGVEAYLKKKSGSVEVDISFFYFPFDFYSTSGLFAAPSIIQYKQI